MNRTHVTVVFCLILVLALFFPVWAGGGKEKVGKAVTLTVPTIQGWVTTDAMMPVISEQLAEENITIKTAPAGHGALRDKQIMEARQGSGAFDVFLTWEAWMPMISGNPIGSQALSTMRVIVISFNLSSRASLQMWLKAPLKSGISIFKCRPTHRPGV